MRRPPGCIFSITKQHDRFPGRLAPTADSRRWIGRATQSAPRGWVNRLDGVQRGCGNRAAGYGWISEDKVSRESAHPLLFKLTNALPRVFPKSIYNINIFNELENFQAIRFFFYPEANRGMIYINYKRVARAMPAGFDRQTPLQLRSMPPGEIRQPRTITFLQFIGPIFYNFVNFILRFRCLVDFARNLGYKLSLSK